MPLNQLPGTEINFYERSLSTNRLMKFLSAIGISFLIVFAFFMLSSGRSQYSSSPSSSTLAAGAGTTDGESFIGKDDFRNPKRVTERDKGKEISIVRAGWELGGFGAIALWHVTFKNNTDKPIGNLKYITYYLDETGAVVDRCGIESFGDNEIRKVIPPRKSRTLEINDCFVHHESHKANFALVDWQYVNDNR